MPTIEETQKMEEEFNKQIEELKASIERVGLRQDEVKSYIIDISATINEVKIALQNLPKDAGEARGKMYLAIQKNNELVSKLYDTIANFESVRHRYQAEIGKITKDKLVFLNIDLKRVEDKLDNTTAGMTKFMRELKEFVSAVGKNTEITDRIKTDLDDKPEYSME